MGKASPHQPLQDHHSVDAKSSGLSVSQMLAAGLASTGAAIFTSRFGVAGTLVGAALTTMIITGGSAILKSYLDTLAGHAKSVPQRINTGRTRANRVRAGRTNTGTIDATRTEAPSEGMAVYGRRRGGERQGFFSKLRSSFGWFSGLSGSRKAGILLGAAVPAVIAFVVAMSAITSVEVVSGRTLSCLTSGTCQTETSGASSNTTFGTLASRASGSSNSDQPFESQLQPPNLAPEQDSSGQQSGNGGGFFGQPADDGSGTEVPTEVPSGTEQPVTPTEEVPTQEVPTQEVPVEEVPTQEVAPQQQAQPSGTESAAPVQ